MGTDVPLVVCTHDDLGICIFILDAIGNDPKLMDMARSTLSGQTAARIRSAIATGAFAAGSSLPSVRTLSGEWSISINTVIAAYRTLEADGLIAALPRSGFVVQAAPAVVGDIPRTPSRVDSPVPVEVGALLLRTMSQVSRTDLLPLGVALPAPDLLPLAALSRRLAQVRSDDAAACFAYDTMPGRPELRRAIARWLLASGAGVDPEDILITNGAQEALRIALATMCRPGSCVAIESPAYPGLIHAIGSLGLAALEIPSSTVSGMDPEALRQALDAQPVAAVLLTSTFSNPSGGCVPPTARLELVDICRSHGVPLIDDDTYGDLAHDAGHRTPCLAHDRDGTVVHVGSFSKSVAPGIRLGFLIARRWSRQVQVMKISTNVATAVAGQLAVARLLDSGDFERHRQRTCPRLGALVHAMAEAVRRHFPAGTRVSQPAGGFIVWVEMPRGIDGVRLYTDAEQAGIGIAPGTLFSPRSRFRHHIRLNAAVAVERTNDAISHLGRLARHQARS